MSETSDSPTSTRAPSDSERAADVELGVARQLLDYAEVKRSSCACANWADQMPKIDGPVVLQQLRSGHRLPPGYFVAWTYCPWCAAALAAAPVPHSENTHG